MRKIRRKLQRAFPKSKITTNGSNHYRVDLPDGSAVIVSGTPKRRGDVPRNAIADARRRSRRNSKPRTTEQSP